MRYIIYSLFICSFLSCSNYQNNSSKETDGQPNDTNAFPDSLFYKKNLSVFDISDDNSFFDDKKTILRGVGKKLKDQLQLCANSGAAILGAYYYSKLWDVEGFTAIVLFIKTLDTQNFVLASVSENYELLSCIQITQDRCDLVDQNDESEEVWCEVKSARIVEPQKVQIIEQNKIEKYYIDKIVSIKDSVVSIYQIDKNGLINVIEKDSIRLPQLVRANE